MPEINKHEIRSPELQEVMSGIPGSFLKWGLFLFFAIILAILGVTWFINYPNIVTAPVTITTYNSPASLVAKVNGNISRLFVVNEEVITINKPVALIDNQADWNDVIIVIRFIDSLKDINDWENVVKDFETPVGLTLGDIQSAWLRFVNAFQRFGEYIGQAYIPSKLLLLEKQIARQEEYLIELENQQMLSEEDLWLSFKSYQRDSGLFDKNNYSISINQLEKSKQALLQKQVSFSSLKSSIKNSESSTLKMRETLLDLRIQYQKEINQYRSDLNESLQMLKVAIGQWKEKYLVESPINGKITFTSFWNKNQIIKAGDILATVIPDERSRIIVRANVPVSGLGRVRVGQEVNIKLSGFPYMEFGVIKGKIKSLSLVPANDVYIAEIDLVSGMRSTYKIELNFISEMTGTADIITDNSRLIFRLIKPLKSIFK
jgi:hypothetical protein